MQNPDLCSAPEQREYLRRKVTDFLHTVASTNFSESRKADTSLLNVGGTRNVVGFLRSCARLERYFHVSTAYVANREQSPLIWEDQPLRLRGFANPYEESKAQAEAVVRRSGLPWAILRPAIFAGHSVSANTGLDHRMGYGVLIGILYSLLAHPEVGGFDGFWRLRSQYNGTADGRRLELGRIRLAGFPDVTKNFMFIDDIASQVACILRSDDVLCKTFHVVGKTPIRTEQMLESIQRALRVSGFYFAGMVRREALSDPIERRASRFVSAVYGPYFLRHEPIWDTTNTDRCLAAKGYRRRDMTPEKFDWLMEEYVNHELCDVLRKETAHHSMG